MPDVAELDALVERAKKGDQNAVLGLLEHFSPQVRAKVRSKVNLPWQSLLDEEDVMQVTSLEACLRIEKFTSGGSREFLAWLYRLAENNLIDAVRSLEAGKRPHPSRRVHTPSSQESKTALVELLGVTHTTPSVFAARDEVVTLLDKALSELPHDYEAVVRLYDLHGRTIEEVAVELKRSQGAVYMLRARAHERLKELLGSASKFFTKY